MIKEKELFQIGNTQKPHAIHGELSVMFNSQAFDLDECPFVVLNVDGIFVPFFIESYRFKTDRAALIKFEGVDTEAEAKRLSRLAVFLPIKYRKTNAETETDIRYFIGFTVIDPALGTLGRVAEIDDTTINTLFIISTDSGQELLIPATDDFVEKMDDEQRILYMNLPEGLMSIY